MKWINAKKETPHHGNDVLVTDGVNVWMGDYSQWRKEGEWSVVYNGAIPVRPENITHWMELPHPMKGYADTNT